jgi:hypothetical protein
MLLQKNKCTEYNKEYLVQKFFINYIFIRNKNFCAQIHLRYDELQIFLTVVRHNT